MRTLATVRPIVNLVRIRHGGAVGQPLGIPALELVTLFVEPLLVLLFDVAPNFVVAAPGRACGSLCISLGHEHTSCLGLGPAREASTFPPGRFSDIMMLR